VRALARLVSGPRACALGAERGHGQRGSAAEAEEEQRRSGARKKKEREKTGAPTGGAGLAGRENGSARWAGGMTEKRRND
jgi:hypothetical protein